MDFGLCSCGMCDVDTSVVLTVLIVGDDSQP
jgi:hypothetical protein